MLLHALLSEADADNGASGVLDKLSKELAVVSDILSGAADGQGLGVQVVLDRGDRGHRKERIASVSGRRSAALVGDVAVVTLLRVTLDQGTVAVTAVDVVVLTQASDHHDTDGLAREELDGGGHLGAGNDFLIVVVVRSGHHLAQAGLELVGTAVGDVLDHHQQRQNDSDEEAENYQANTNLGASAEIVTHLELPLFIKF